MRYLSIDRIKPGSRLGKPLYGAKSLVLLKESVELSESLLCRLKSLGYSGLYIEDDISEGIEIEDTIEEKLRLETTERLEDIILRNGNMDDIKPLISEIIDNIVAKKDVVLNLNQMRGYHNYTYLHCVNVGIISAGIGLQYKFNRSKLIDLGTSGILHDIGKSFIPTAILDKPGKLTREEYELIQKHPEQGYKMLQDTMDLCLITKRGILEHHERYDGSGYPHGLRGDNITLFGRILAVADTYDAMTTDRSYRSAFLPSEAVEYLMGAGNHFYDTKVIECFTKCISVYPVGTCVELSDGTKAIVVKNYSDCILRPLVRDINNKKLIDLKNDSNYLSICIKKLDYSI